MGLLAQILYDKYQQGQERRQAQEMATYFQEQGNQGGGLLRTPDFNPDAYPSRPNIYSNERPGMVDRPTSLLGQGAPAVQWASQAPTTEAPLMQGQRQAPTYQAPQQTGMSLQGPQQPVMQGPQQPVMQGLQQPVMQGLQQPVMPGQGPAQLPPMTVAGQMPDTRAFAAQQAGMFNGFNPLQLNDQYFNQYQAQAMAALQSGIPGVQEIGAQMLNNAYGNRSSRLQTFSGNAVQEQAGLRNLAENQYQSDRNFERGVLESDREFRADRQEFQDKMAEERRQFEIEQLMSKATAGELTPQEKNTQEKNLRTEYRPRFEDNKRRIDSYNRVFNMVEQRGSVNKLTGADDIQLIREYIKAITPNEAIMTDDQRAAMAAAGLSGTVESYMSILTGKGTLGAKGRNEMMNNMRTNADYAFDEINTSINPRFATLATRSTVDPEDVIEAPPQVARREATADTPTVDQVRQALESQVKRQGAPRGGR